jgi:hypothetical protein
VVEILGTTFSNAGDKFGVKLFVGGHAGKIQGEREDLVGDRMFTAAYRPYPSCFNCSQLNALLDSGACSDSWAKRLSPEQALERQLAWEHKATQLWEQPWQCFGDALNRDKMDKPFMGDLSEVAKYLGERACPFCPDIIPRLVSYDLLIDEIWVGGKRQKQRWTVKQVERAVAVTVDAANYLALQRREKKRTHYERSPKFYL